jgi:hypothetical protein
VIRDGEVSSGLVKALDRACVSCASGGSITRRRCCFGGGELPFFAAMLTGVCPVSLEVFRSAPRLMKNCRQSPLPVRV